MIKRIISLVLVLIMSMTLFAGCGKNKMTAKVKNAVDFDTSNYDLNSIEGKTQALKDYLLSIYGHQTLAGQDAIGESATELVYIYSETGKLPALRGFDFAGMERDSTADTDVKLALNWHNNCNGIVTFWWHWRVPIDINDYSKGFDPWSKNTDFNASKAITEGTKENKLIIQNIDMIAAQLKRLEMADVPVLFRPLHEGSLKCFWWGAKGPYAYKALWNIVYDRLMNYHKLKNLIWIWNGQDKEWMPDPDTFDIASIDNYSEDDVIADKFKEMDKYTNGKMLAISECGPIPSVQKMQKMNAKWLFWMTWYADYVYTSDNGKISSNSKYTTVEQLRENYHSKYVITLDELPLLGAKNKRNLPESVQYYIDTGNIEGNAPEWENGKIKLEFELGYNVGVSIKGKGEGISGVGFVQWAREEQETFVVCSVPKGQAGEYKATVRYMAKFGTKLESLIVNGMSTNTVEYPKGETWEDMVIDVELKEGINYLGFNDKNGSWGYINLDYVELEKK